MQLGTAPVKLTRLQIWLVSLLVVASLSATQALVDTVSKPTKAAVREAVLKNETPLIPSPKILKLVAFGNEPLLADLIWLQTIQYFGVGSPYQKYAALGPMVDTVTQLDPKFAYPYQFGLVALPFMGQSETAVKLGLRAREALPEDGLLTFYTASVYHLNLKDYRKAGELYALSATLKGTPSAATSLAGTALARVQDSVSDRQAAIVFWEAVVQNAKTDEERNRAIAWYKHMQIVYSLEISSDQFKIKEGRYAASFDELIATGYIGKVPESPIERIFTYDAATGRVGFERVKGD
jgi:tetratricopeptide (TPR) repeat protein